MTVRIYSLTGELIRTLDIGKRQRGIYVSPEQAVYWDGTDEVGAPVASGVYFYQLSAGGFRQTPRMVLVK